MWVTGNMFIEHIRQKDEMFLNKIALLLWQPMMESLAVMLGKFI